MQTLPRFPDATDVTRLLLLDFKTRFPLGAYQVGGDLSGVAQKLDYVFVERIGGPRTRLNDYPLVDVEVFSATHKRAESLIEEIDALLLGYPHSVTVGTSKVTIDRAESRRSPVELPWDDSGVRRYGATYQFSVRR